MDSAYGLFTPPGYAELDSAKAKNGLQKLTLQTAWAGDGINGGGLFIRQGYTTMALARMDLSDVWSLAVSMCDWAEPSFMHLVMNSLPTRSQLPSLLRAHTMRDGSLVCRGSAGW